MLKNLVVLTALAIGSIAVAHADPIVGIINLVGNDTFTGSTITFGTASIGGTSTGTFAPLTAGNPVTMFPNFTGPLPYFNGPNIVPAPISPVEVMTTTEGGITFDFFMTSYDAMVVSHVTGCSLTCLDVTGNGFFTATGFTQTPGSFTFTSQETSLDQTSLTTFSATGSAVPEPASLALFGTGLLGIVGVARRRFKV